MTSKRACLANDALNNWCLLFTNDTDVLAEKVYELEGLAESLHNPCTRYNIEISAEKTKLMTKKANEIQKEINKKGFKLETVTSFTYLEAIASDDS